jgi:signal transduction histidine kinase
VSPSVKTHCFDSRDSDIAAALTRSRMNASGREPLRSASPAGLLREDAIRLEERCRERARIGHELHDTLLQGFLGASLLLHAAMEQTGANSPSRPALSRALHLVRRAIDEGRAAIEGLQVILPLPSASNLEQAFAIFLGEITPAQGAKLRVYVQGKPRAIKPAIQEQLFLIGREAVVNALRHSGAAMIEIEVQYRCNTVCVLVRDNGCGICPEAVQKAQGSHWGLRGMRDRGEDIGARFGIWSRPGSGTEVHVTVPVEIAAQP